MNNVVAMIVPEVKQFRIIPCHFNQSLQKRRKSNLLTVGSGVTHHSNVISISVYHWYTRVTGGNLFFLSEKLSKILSKMYGKKFCFSIVAKGSFPMFQFPLSRCRTMGYLTKAEHIHVSHREISNSSTVASKIKYKKSYSLSVRKYSVAVFWKPLHGTLIP